MIQHYKRLYAQQARTHAHYYFVCVCVCVWMDPSTVVFKIERLRRRPQDGAAKKATTKQIAESLKKSGLEKLAKINRTKIESDISFALRHGKITKQEAAAIDPKNFKILLDNSKTKTIAIVNPKTGKVTRGK